MKLVQNTIGRLVQRISGKARSQTKAQQRRQPAELDAKALRHVSGGTVDSPYKGW